MKVYISVPMTGRTVKEVEEDIRQAKKDFAFNGKKTKFVSNLDVFKQHPDLDAMLAMATAIERMADCDAILVCPNWKASTGCRLEVATAISYNLPVYGADAEYEMVIKRKPRR